MPTNRYYYADSIQDFLTSPANTILGVLASSNEFDLGQAQRDAWLEQIRILKEVLTGRDGRVYFEYAIPRLGRRIDAVVLIGPVVFVLEFKVGDSDFASYATEQVWDYALDLKNFHEASHDKFIAPIHIATKAEHAMPAKALTSHLDNVLAPIRCTVESLGPVMDDAVRFADGAAIDPTQWEQGRYCPTPTIIEAAMALYGGHSVTDISRNDATAINLGRTSSAISEIIRVSKDQGQKAICFVTGVPGAGKTLVGLNIATQHIDQSSELYSVFLSGNGPLVAILREALARDRVRREKEQGRKIKRGQARSEVKTFIQNIHHFRDDCLVDLTRPPIEHVAIFDEAQRAWNLHQTADFMRRKKQMPDFNQSEPDFLISCLDRHADWAVVICLVGGGQEINTGEAGISEWIEALNRSFPNWQIYVSSRLTDSEYGAGSLLESLISRPHVAFKDELHLAVSMRSFRTEHVSLLVKQILDLHTDSARQTLANVTGKYPMVITRDLTRAKQWLKAQARGSERYGIVVSSQAERLRPYAIDIRAKIDPIHWFLDGREDIRSSYYLEDVATEFHVQGLELDWACVTWDADFRRAGNGWEHWSFVGDRWNRIKKEERKNYLKNAYRVLLTRARQGMVIVVPPGDGEDPTRKPEFYDTTFAYLRDIGFAVI